MIGLSTTTPNRWSPPWLAGDPDSPVFLWVSGSTIDRALLEAQADGEYQAGRVFQHDFDAAFIEGVNTLLHDDPEKDHLIGLMASQSAGEPLSPEEAATLFEAKSSMARHWPAYRALVAQQARRNKILPLLAFARFVRGWQGLVDNDDLPLAYLRDGVGGVAESVLRLVPEQYVIGLGSEIYASLYAGAQEKNSAPLLKSEDGQPTSPLGADSAAAG